MYCSKILAGNIFCDEQYTGKLFCRSYTICKQLLFIPSIHRNINHQAIYNWTTFTKLCTHKCALLQLGLFVYMYMCICELIKHTQSSHHPCMYFWVCSNINTYWASSRNKLMQCGMPCLSELVHSWVCGIVIYNSTCLLQTMQHRNKKANIRGIPVVQLPHSSYQFYWWWDYKGTTKLRTCECKQQLYYKKLCR